MGKEAVEVSNQHGSEQIGATNFKDEQIAGQNQQKVSPFPYDQSMGESQKDFQQGSTFQSGPDVGTGLEIRPPVGGFHGDKWQNVHDGGQFKSDRQDAFKSDRQDAPLMEDPNAGGFHGDKWKDSQWSALPPTHSDVHASNRVGDHWGDKAAYSDWQAKNDVIKNEAREGKQAMHAELKSHAGGEELIKPSDISGNRFDGMTAEGNTVMPQSVNLHDGRSAVNIYDGRDATSINDGRTDEEMPLKERVVSGVHEGDPFSHKAGKKDKKLKKQKDKDAIHSGFPNDEHLKSDRGLIPHEHLKKDHHIVPTEHISGGQDQIFKEKHQHDAEHLRQLHDNPNLHGDTAVHGGQALPGTFVRESDYDRDAYLAKDLNRNSPHALEDQGTKGGTLKEKVHRKKEKLKEKLGMKKDEDLKVTDSQAHPRGHEIATIKIPGIEARDRAAQEMVNQQAKAKKELNAELKGHAGHSDHITPSEIHSHGTTHHETSGAKVSTHLTMPAACVITDPLTRDQVISKAEVNAEIRDHAGDLGSTGQIKPSEVSGSSLDHPQSSMGYHESSSMGQDQGIKSGMYPDERLRSPDQGIQSGIYPSQGIHSTIPSQGIHAGEGFQTGQGFQSGQGINQNFGNKDLTHDSSLGSSNLSGGHIGTFGNKDLTHDSALGSSNLAGGHMSNFGSTGMPHGSLGSSNLSGGHTGTFGSTDMPHSSLDSSNLSGGHMDTFGNKDMSHDLPGGNIEPFANKDVSHEPLASIIGNKDMSHDSSLGSSNLSGGHMGSFGNKDMTHGSLGSSNFGSTDMPHSSLGSSNLAGGHMNNFGSTGMPHSSLGSSNLSGGHMGTFGNKDMSHDSLGSRNLPGENIEPFANKDVSHEPLASIIGNKDMSHDSSLGSSNLSGGHMGTFGSTGMPHSSLGSSNLSGGHMSNLGSTNVPHSSLGSSNFGSTGMPHGSLGSSNVSGGHSNFGSTDMPHGSLGSSNVSGAHRDTFGNKDITSLDANNLSRGHMDNFGNNEVGHGSFKDIMPGSSLGSSNLPRHTQPVDSDLKHDALASMTMGVLGHKDVADNTLGASHMTEGHIGPLGNKDMPHDSLGSSNLSGGHMGTLGNRDLTHDPALGSSNLSGGHMAHGSSLGSSNLSGGHMGSFGNKDMTHGSLGSSNLSGGHTGTFGSTSMPHSSLGSSNVSGGHMDSFGNNEVGHGSFKDTMPGSSLGSSNLPRHTQPVDSDLKHDALASMTMGVLGHKDVADNTLGASHMTEGHIGPLGNKGHDSLGSTNQNIGSRDMTHSARSDNLSGGLGTGHGINQPHHDSFASDSLSSGNIGHGTHQTFGNKDLTHDSLGSSNLSGGHMGTNKDLTHDSLASDKSGFGTNQTFGNKDLTHDSLASDRLSGGTHGSNHGIVDKDVPHKSSDTLSSGTGISQPILNNTPDNRSGGLDANNDHIMKDQVHAKKEVNAPSEMGAVTTEETHHLSTKEKIKEKVNAAAQAVKDTFKMH